MRALSFSVVIPAHNEEALIGACLDSVARAAERVGGRVETIVVLNACTDGTERIVRAQGAVVTTHAERNLAGVRNAGAALASGDVLVTIDADSRMSANALAEAACALASGRYIGGGVPLVGDRMSPGILCSVVVILTICVALGVPSAGMFWCMRRDFEAIGGFDERLHVGEDVDFARRLRAHGRKAGKRYGTLWKARLHTSCRKFDEFGDWFPVKLLLRNPRILVNAMRGREQAIANRYWYDVKR